VHLWFHTCRAAELPADVSTQPVKSSTWNGYSRMDFDVDGRACILVEPKVPAVGKPWIWRTEFFGVEPQADIALLAAGFHVAYMNVQNMYAAPVALDHMDAFYDYLTRERKLSTKPALEGFSRGGLFAFNWSARHPDRLSCIYADAPVCDLKSWPGGHRADKTAADWHRMLNAYGFTSDQQALDYKQNPIDNLEPVADARIPILCVCGEADDVVPINQNTRVVEQRYTQLGGPVTVIAKPFCNHHPHSLQNPTPIVNFVLSHSLGVGNLPIKTPNTPYGYDYFILRATLNNSRLKFERAKTGRVVFLGGSITNMKGWRDLVCEDLQRRFPQTKFDFINAGIPSTGSTPGAFRFSRDVLSHGAIDLLFEDAAVNDEVNGQSDPEQIRGMEGIIRQALLANRFTDIVMLHFADPPKLELIRRGETPAVIANHEKVAVHYQVSAINLAQEVAERINAGEFTWEKDFKDLHPAPFGQQLYANAIARLFDAAWAIPLDPAAAAQPHPLPVDLIDPGSYFQGRLISPDAATVNNDWQLVKVWKPSDGASTRPGFVNVPALVSEKPGATLHLRFTGTAAGVFVAAGPDAGMIEYAIDGGNVEVHDLYTKWSAKLHLPWARVLAANLPPGQHDLMLRVASGHNDKSKGTAVRIIHFLVNGTVEAEAAGAAEGAATTAATATTKPVK
jgi:pimeloyl-ACP methyl ester carboxylesterase